MSSVWRRRESRANDHAPAWRPAVACGSAWAACTTPAAAALKAAFTAHPVIVGEGGSIPVVDDFARTLEAPVLLMGFGLPGENAHAPDEWMSAENFDLGCGPWRRCGIGSAAGGQGRPETN